MQIKGEGYTVFFDLNKGEIDIFGSIRLRGTTEYQEIFNLMLKALDERRDEGLVLNISRLEYLNSSGINTIGKFIITARQKEISSLKILGNSEIQWQKKTLQNLQRLWPKLSLEIN